MNDDSWGTYNTNSQIEFITSTLKSGLCDYSDVYILVQWIITVPNTSAAGAAGRPNNKEKIILKTLIHLVIA